MGMGTQWLHNIHPWRYSELYWTQLWATRSNSNFELGPALNDLDQMTFSGPFWSEIFCGSMKQLVYYDKFFFPPNLISCVRTMKCSPHTFKKITYSVSSFALEVSGRISRAPLYHQSCTFCLLQLEICTAYSLHIPPSEMSGNIILSGDTLLTLNIMVISVLLVLDSSFSFI